MESLSQSVRRALEHSFRWRALECIVLELDLESVLLLLQQLVELAERWSIFQQHRQVSLWIEGFLPLICCLSRTRRAGDVRADVSILHRLRALHPRSLLVHIIGERWLRIN